MSACHGKGNTRRANRKKTLSNDRIPRSLSDQQGCGFGISRIRLTAVICCQGSGVMRFIWRILSVLSPVLVVTDIAHSSSVSKVSTTGTRSRGEPRLRRFVLCESHAA